MIEQLRQDPAALVVLGFYLVAAIFGLLGIYWIARDECQRRDSLDCDLVHQEMQARRAAAAKAYREAEQARKLRVWQLNQQLDGKPVDAPKPRDPNPAKVIPFRAHS